MQFAKSKGTYIDLHLLVDAIVHNQTMSKTNTMRLHGMASNICVVPDIRIIEVSNLLAITDAILRGRIDRCESGHHL